MAPRIDSLIRTQGFIFILEITASYFKLFLVKVCTCLRMRIKVLSVMLAWFVRPDINTGWPLLCMVWLGLCPHHSTLTPVFISGRTNQARFKSNTFISLTKTLFPLLSAIPSQPFHLSVCPVYPVHPIAMRHSAHESSTGSMILGLTTNVWLALHKK